MRRVGIVGAGIRGQLFARCLTDRATVVGAADVNVDRARALAETVGATAYPDHEALIGSGEIDTLVVATPDPFHRDVAVAGAEAGLDLLIEKPLATTVADGEAIRDAVARHGVKAMVAFENRWSAKFATLHELVRRGELGEVLFQVALLNDTIMVPTQMLSWSAATTPAWFLMPHTVDLALWTRRSTPTSVYAVRRKGTVAGRGIDTPDGLHALVSFDNGGVLTLQSHWVLPETHPSVFDFRFEIVGTDGAISVDGADRGLRHTGSAYSWIQSGTYEQHGEIRGGSAEMVSDFLRYIDGEDIDVPTVETALTVTRVVAAVHDSAETGDVIRL